VETARLVQELTEFVGDSPIPQIVHTADGRFLACSRELTRVTGYTCADVPTIREWLIKARRIPEDKADVLVDEYLRRIAKGPPYASIDVEVYAHDGEVRNWLVQVTSSYERGGERILVSSAIDLTDKKKAEREVQEREEFLQRIFNAHPTVLYVYDLEKQAPVFQNRQIGSDLGYTFDEIHSMGTELPMRLTHPEDRAKLPRQFARLREAADHEILEIEYRLRAKDGSWHHFISRDTPFKRGADGKVVQIIGVATNVTESRRVEQERLEMSMHVQELQKMESLAMLAGGIAHDFNNLLIGIMGSADLAMMQLPATSPAHDDLKRIQTTSVECAELCKQLLAYAGKGKFVVEPFYLADMIQEIGHLLQISISKKIALRYDFSDNVPAVEGDIRQIRQVIMNLIRNASDAIGDRSGVITVSVGLVEANKSYLETTFLGEHIDEGYFVTLEVSDTGAGIARADLPKIFDPFFSKKREGRGLGLAAVRGIIKGHGGAMRVYSEQGKGSSFKILLPASEKPVAQPKPVEPTHAASLGGGTVLVVDDEETVRVVTTRSLKMMGFSVLIATDGREAIAIYREYRDEIRVVLLDMMMPGLGGAQTFQRLRQLDPEVNVILMSGYNEQEATNAFAGKGLAGFLQKPFKHQDLADTIERALIRAADQD
jgi:PAS domain S-box-containing protein